MSGATSGNEWDYLVVGAGSAGCVLANRLSEDLGKRVLLIEAGPRDRNPFLHIPKGFTRTLADSRLTWRHRTEPPFAGAEPEVWPRGRTLGGSSAVNGMMYVKGHPQDYEDWKASGLTGWGWDEIGAAFEAMEGHGLAVSLRPEGTLEAWDALISAGEELGLPVRDDLNAGAGPGIGFLPATIRRGWRSSAACAFLAPLRKRSNLCVRTGLTAERVIFAGRKATGVAVRLADGREELLQARETILSAGALSTPLLLQRSGIGPAQRLARLGLAVVADNHEVGENLIEHRLLGFQYRIRKGGHNAQLRGLGLGLSIARYLALRTGPIATGAYQIGAFVPTLPDAIRPDAELLMGAYSIDPARGGMTMEHEPGLRIITFPMRPRSKGYVRLASPDGSLPPSIFANYLADPYDQAVSIASARFIRSLAAQPALARLIVAECLPGAAIESDEDILSAFLRQGTSGMHASSTCRMGADDGAVVDRRLRVRGVDGLRVMDCSVLPTMVSGNTNGPVMAMAWNAARIIREDGR